MRPLRVNQQHYLPDLLVLIEQIMRVPDLSPRKQCVDPGHDTTLLDERPNLLHQFRRNLSLVGCRPRPQRRARQRQPAANDRPDVNFRRLAEMVPSGDACTLLDAEGGWYAVLQVPTFESEEDLAVRLLREHAVLVHPGYFFDFARESYLVVSLLPPEDRLAQGISRVLGALRERSQG